MYGQHLPLLSHFAPIVLAQPAAASAAERNWSVYGQIHTSNKSRMSHRTADKLVYCHEALHIRNKQSAERWDSDSDSDESDEEDLKV